ncbi:MAG: TIGR00730 family Rossman fold protein [Zetaproteobacteria bacterium]|nr:MAG: TIGR00730 family Rossman fold protein [Zetaproteobacteria bacterium]
MNNIHKFTVYLGSSGRCRPIFKETAKALGNLIGEHGKSLIYGGMDAGLMGIVANNALSSGAHVTGIIPKKLKDSERIHPDLNETILVPDLWERKLKMFQRADAIIALAGGFGTIDEVLEALYWADLGAHAKPIILVNTDNYWDDFIAYLYTLPDLSRDHLIIADNVTDIFDKLQDWTPPKITGDVDNMPHFEDEILCDTDEPIIFEKTSVKDGYFLATALGLKQLDKHQRNIGLLNDQGQFDSLIRWISHAQKECFITDRCTQLFNVETSLLELHKKLKDQTAIHINLEKEKWGPSETKTHIELRETE